MASGFELRYPTGGSYTGSWIPEVAPNLNGPPMQEITGLFGELMADGKTEYGYRILSSGFWIYPYKFKPLTDTERLALATFQALVGTGPFDFKEGACGVITAFRKVQFHPDNLKREWPRVMDGQHFETTIILMDAP